jgi:DNA-binding transcriptional regulator YiaG
MSTAASTEERSGETSSSDSEHRGHRSLSQEAFEDRLRQRRKGRPTQHSAAVAAVPDASQVRSGLEVGLLNELLEQLGLSQEAFARMMGVSVRTLQRRRAESGGRLTPAESDRLWHLLHVLGPRARGPGKRGRGARLVDRGESRPLAVSRRRSTSTPSRAYARSRICSQFSTRPAWRNGERLPFRRCLRRPSSPGNAQERANPRDDLSVPQREVRRVGLSRVARARPVAPSGHADGLLLRRVSDGAAGDARARGGADLIEEPYVLF